MTPILEYKNLKDAVESLKEWRERLGISDWIIKIMLCEPHEFIGSDRDGECEYTTVIKNAVIRILKPEYYGDRIMKYCAERILVHELLHCKFALLETNDEGFNLLIHQTLEDMVKALICAKYNIKNDWFNNIDYDEVI